MTRTLTLILLILFASASCRKEFSAVKQSEQIKQLARQYLESAMPAQEFAKIDFQSTMITNNPVTFIRVGFFNRDVYANFVLLKMDSSSKTIQGAKIIELEFSDEQLNGTFMRYSLDRSSKEEFIITNGYLHKPRVLSTGFAFGQHIVEDDGYLGQKSFAKLYPADAGMRPVDYISLEHAWSRPQPAGRQSYAYFQRNAPPPPPTQTGGGGGTSSPPPVKRHQAPPACRLLKTSAVLSFSPCH